MLLQYLEFGKVDVTILIQICQFLLHGQARILLQTPEKNSS